MRSFLRRCLAWAFQKLKPAPDPKQLARENEFLRKELNAAVQAQFDEQRKADYMERVAEMVEARQMAGSGPWRVSSETLKETDALIARASKSIESGGIRLREDAITQVGATADINLMLENIEWRREVNLSWLEFSRWGIQQIILISRLQYVKDPLIQRAINVSAQYVFGRGFEVMSEDDDANAVLSDFFKRNNKVFGQAAMVGNQKRLGYDGQVFFVFFPDELETGEVNVRTIDATEIFEIITSPDDTDEIWLYRRKWSARVFDMVTGATSTKSEEAYYPAMGYEPTLKPPQIGGIEVMWGTPVKHHKGGVGVSKWHFDVPRAYAALEYAKSVRRWLAACLTVRQALSQIAIVLTTKGGQQAIEGAKSQLGSNVGPASSLYDSNPPAIAGSTFASGPGTTLSAFNTKGAGGDPSDVKEYRAMVANVFEIPPTFLGDIDTATYATASTLDRPTELGMYEKQESWREFFVEVAREVLKYAQGATNGKLRERAKSKIIEMAGHRDNRGRWVYDRKEAVELTEAKKDASGDIEIQVNFPAIREGDRAANIKAIAEAMTLDNKSGQVVGIDEKVGVGLLFKELDVDDYGDIVDKMYPKKISGTPGRPGYDPDRTKAPIAPPIPKPSPIPGGEPQAPGGNPTVPPPVAPAPPAAPAPVKAAERFIRALESLVSRKAS